MNYSCFKLIQAKAEVNEEKKSNSLNSVITMISQLVKL